MCVLRTCTAGVAAFSAAAPLAALAVFYIIGTWARMQGGQVCALHQQMAQWRSMLCSPVRVYSCQGRLPVCVRLHAAAVAPSTGWRPDVCSLLQILGPAGVHVCAMQGVALCLLASAGSVLYAAVVHILPTAGHGPRARALLALSALVPLAISAALPE